MTNKLFEQDSELTSFMQQGKTGAYREGLSAETIKRFQEWEKKWLEGTDLRFQYD